MVHIHARGITLGPRFQNGHLAERPDGARITAMSGAIAVNVLALLMLLMPMSMPPPLALPDKPDEGMKLVPVKPEVVEITKPLPLPRPEVQPREVVEPRAQPEVVSDPAPVVVESGEPADPVVVAERTDVVALEPVTPSIAAVRLEYASAPPPAYPRDALRRRLEGTVMLQVLVDVDGRPLEVLVHGSSGHRSLDEAARRHVLKQWTFRPAMKDGRAVQAIGLVPVAFEMR